MSRPEKRETAEVLDDKVVREGSMVKLVPVKLRTKPDAQNRHDTVIARLGGEGPFRVAWIGTLPAHPRRPLLFFDIRGEEFSAYAEDFMLA